MIKNAKRDKMDYQAMRNIIKQDPTKKESLLSIVADHLDAKLANKTFVYPKSQKEVV